MPVSTPIARELLAWYDRHRRDLPWRPTDGRKPDPYAVWLSEIMLQQTTVAAVKPYYANFLARWPDVRALAAAPRAEILHHWAGLGYYARARNLHDCAAAVVARHGGRFPAEEAQLRDLPGIGDYTAAAVAAIAFGKPAAVVDGNVERVTARLFAIDAPLPQAKPAIRKIVAGLVPKDRPGDFAQSMMDLGATLCTPRSPACALCPVRGHCAAHKQGDPASFPRRLAKAPRPLRLGAMAVITRQDGAVLVRTRPSSGLLGGMTEFYGTDWTASEPDEAALRSIAEDHWQAKGVIDHIFTHFALRLAVFSGRTRARTAPEGYRWVTSAELLRSPLPSVMQKVLRAAQAPDQPSAILPLGADPLRLISLAGADQQSRRQGEDGEAQASGGTGDGHDSTKANESRHGAQRRQGKNPTQHGRKLRG